MRWTLLFLVSAFMTTALSAQDGQLTTAEESDPRATAILDKLRKKYDSYTNLEAQFTLEIKLPEQGAETQQGTLARSGEKYRLELGSRTIISNGEAVYLILHNNKEVQINDIPEQGTESMLSPQALFNFYENDEFVYFLINEFKEGGRVVQQIEFKPTNRDVDYTKLRMTVDKQKQEVTRMTAFGRDASQYVFKMDGLEPGKTFPEGHFQFDEKDYPDYYVEDLRF